MNIVSLYSLEEKEIEKFLTKFYNTHIEIPNKLKWERKFDNPIEMADIVGAFIDNNDKFNINMWISLDEDFFLNVTDYNVDQIIRYLFERYPY